MGTPSNEMQKFVLQALLANTGVATAVGGRIYDGVPKGATFPYIAFGASDYTPDDADCITAREETLQIDIWSNRQGKRSEAAAITDLVKAALHTLTGDIGQNALISMEVTLARVMLDQDRIIAHGIVQVTALIEERAPAP